MRESFNVSFNACVVLGFARLASSESEAKIELMTDARFNVATHKERNLGTDMCAKGRTRESCTCGKHET